jgi:hypothetical protein
MACTITSGLALGCRDNMGGIKRVLLNNSSVITSVAPADNTGTSTITTFVSASAPAFYEFVPSKMSSNWTENIQANVQNGTTAYEQVLNLIFAKNQAATRDQIKLLGQASLVGIVEDRNGKYWYLGEVNGLDLTGGSSNSGTALSDLNGWTLNFTAMEHYPAREVTGSLISTLI